MPAWKLSTLALSLGCALGGCADAPSPLEPQPSALAATKLEGSYLLAARQALADAELYALQVHFGSGGEADGRTYLVQLGVSRSGHAALTLRQERYTMHGDTIVFGGDVLARGVLSADARVLRTSVQVAGAVVPVTLERR